MSSSISSSNSNSSSSSSSSSSASSFSLPSDLEKALDEKDVQHNLQQAWNKTQDEEIEYGGWIYKYNTTDSKIQYKTKQKTDKQASSITLTQAKDLLQFEAPEKIILADFHCHPAGKNKGDKIAAGKPSAADVN